MDQAPILSLRDIQKSFGPVHVLKGVNFDAYSGQVTALVGDNGAGKSTLIKCIAGIYNIDQGDYLFDGNRVEVHGPRDATSLGIEIVYQDLALCDNLDIVHNMFLGREKKKGMVLNEEEMESLARKTLDGLSVRTVKSIRKKVASLSGGQRQTVAIARAVLWNSKVVILDEPTAGMNPQESQKFIDFIRKLIKDKEISVMLIEHDMKVVMSVSERITVLDQGEKIAEGGPDDIRNNKRVIEAYLGKSRGGNK